ncbi:MULTISPECIES: siphovirus Gp157 family protein [Bacillus cereus group]|uniref:siphovirus Gp157 family protein n=1 Tax=Bacillus TaxID=1386 RepID=UPI0001A1D53B|nr:MULTISPECIES: siphovirus Gp157 family protein [Bacillus cereus group]EEM68451.1 hypothetical protein bthur0009_54470 [Bacillus thuringiensis serovar andalousiensis BGSC 4AW1]MEB9630848.1 siphovirus Gp157 family protein [Bacillus anthracis]
MNLYTLAINYKQVQEMIEDGADYEVIKDTLEAIQEGIQDKAQNVALLVKNINADVEAIKTEEKRLSERRKALENKSTKLKDYLKEQMEFCGIERIKSTIVSIGIQKNPPTLNIADNADIPEEYYRQREPEIDKRKLMQDVKEGFEFDGVAISQTTGVRIR